MTLGIVVIVHLHFAGDNKLFSDTAKRLKKRISLFGGYCRLWQLIVSLPNSKSVLWNKGY